MSVNDSKNLTQVFHKQQHTSAGQSLETYTRNNYIQFTAILLWLLLVHKYIPYLTLFLSG